MTHTISQEINQGFLHYERLESVEGMMRRKYIMETDGHWGPPETETKFEIELDKARIDARDRIINPGDALSPVHTWNIASRAAQIVETEPPYPIAPQNDYTRGAAVYLWQELEGLSVQEDQAGYALQLGLNNLGEPKNFAESATLEFTELMREILKQKAEGKLLDGSEGIPADEEVILAMALVGLLSTVYLAGRDDQIHDIFGTNGQRTVRAHEMSQVINASDGWLAIYGEAFSAEEKRLLRACYDSVRGILNPKARNALHLDDMTTKEVAHGVVTEMYGSSQLKLMSEELVIETAAMMGIRAFLVKNGLVERAESEEIGGTSGNGN